MMNEQIEAKALESRDTFIHQVLAMLDFVGLERSKLNKIQTFMEDNFPGLATPFAVSGLQWVKASERLPETEDEAITIIPVFFRRKGNKYAGTFSDMAFWAYSVCFNQSHYDEVEWLDESSPSQQSFHS